MDLETVTARAQAHCEALLAGDIDRATEDFSQELHSNLGEVISLLPLPITEATVDSVDMGGKGYVVVLRLVGESETVLLQTRWKDRDGDPTIVEASHVVEHVDEPLPEEETPAD